MLKKMKYILGLFFLIAGSAQAYVPVEGNVSAVLAPTVTWTDYQSGRPGVETSYFGAMSLIAQGDISHRGALEISMIHMHKVFFVDRNGSFLGEQSEYIHISMGYRRWLTPYFSTALAFYSAYSMGEPQVVTSSLQPGSELTTSARDKTEYGFDLSLQGELYAKDRIAIVLDGRYSYSVTAKKHEHGNQYQAMLGLRYFIQEKTVMEKPKTSL